MQAPGGTYNNLTLHVQVTVVEQPDFNPRLVLEEPEDQVLRRRRAQEGARREEGRESEVRSVSVNLGFGAPTTTDPCMGCQGSWSPAATATYHDRIAIPGLQCPLKG